MGFTLTFNMTFKLTHYLGNKRLAGCVALFAFSLVLLVYRAWGQTGPYENTVSAPLNENVAGCGGTILSKNITVGDSFTITDVDLGLLINHTYRGDIQANLTSPSSTTVALVTNDGGNGLNNYNVRFDDAAGNNVNSAPHNTSDGLSAPPYENTVRPLGNLSDFDGEDAQGVWVLDMCDFYNLDAGDFQRANLYFTAATGSDMSLALAASDTTPNIGNNVVLTVTATHTGPVAATGITADFNLPTGLSYVSDNGGGNYNSGTGVWSIPGSLSNASTSLQITAFVNASGNYDIVSEIATASGVDPDSTPGNGDTGEDDYDSLTLAPVTPAVPVLSCPGAPSVMDWDIVVWGEGDLNNTYIVDAETIAITISDPDNSLQDYGPVGGQTPIESTANTGGLSPAEASLHFLADQPNRASTVDMTIALGDAGVGVAKFQMSIWDVDLGASQFEDQITVTGTLGGTPVPVTLFTSSANSASGSAVTGVSGAGSTSGVGNMTLEFNAAIDTLVINYGNGSNAPANPGIQGIALHDFNFCPVLSAVLSAQKSTALYDPLSEGLYMVPGNDVIYTITFTNSGDGAADNDSVVIIDAIPSEIEFYNGDIDDGGPETTAVTGTDNGSGLTFNYAADVRYSNSGSPPANFAACNYTPSAGYDANVTYICVNPSGVMAAGNPDPSFDVKFRARIK